MNAFIIAAPKSGGGKTTLSIALMKALSETYEVLPFKVGPDYIDPMFHRFVLDKPSYNLDIPMCGEKNVKEIFWNKVNPDSIAIVEGVMGLFDGREDGFGSSAHVAQVLNIPVILVLDARGVSTSLAALVKGFADFKIFNQKPVKIAGVILNQVKNEGVYKLLKAEIEKHTSIPVLGFILDDSSIALNSRHLGLIPPDEVENLQEKIQRAGERIKESVDLDKLLEKTSVEPIETPILSLPNIGKGLRLGVARDEAFNFYYQDNLEILEALGFKLCYFSPLKDEQLPKDIVGLYLGGGFPEVFAEELEQNIKLKEEILDRLQSGLYCYAECGGLIYLSKNLTYHGKTFEMVGFLENEIQMTDRLEDFGYAEIEINDYTLTAHEFHHSHIEKEEELTKPYRITQRGKKRLGGQIKGNTLAAYPHIHFLAQEDGLDLLITFLKHIVEKDELEDYC